MKYLKFVQYLGELESISSRLAITDTLSKLIKEMDDDEVEKGIYLVLGQLGPDFDKVDFGMAVKMVIRAVAEGSGRNVSEVEKMYKKKGDLGELAREIRFDETKIKSYSVVEIFDHLMEIAKDSGQGSQERKVISLRSLLCSISAEERKYLVRIVLGRLRLGFSEKTIFDALSKIESGGKEKRKELDTVYQIYPNPGIIAAVVKSKGFGGLKNIKVKTGVPVVPALCQRLNSSEEIVSKMKDVAVERKYDGTRVQIHFDRSKNVVRTYTRNLEETSWMFPELKNMGDWVNGKSVILDCEAVGIDKKTGKVLSFQITITRKRKHDVAETAESVPLRFFLFDILSKDGEDLINKPYFERRKILSETIKKNEVIVPDEYVRANKALDVKELHEKYLKEGFEGAVVKMWNGEYLPGRQGWNWVKIKEAEGTTGKLSDTMDLVVLGYYYGRGKRAAFGIGAFLVGLEKEGKWVSLAKIGTGLTDKEFKQLKKELDDHVVMERPKNYSVEGTLTADVWVEPSVVVEVAADEITKSPTHAAGVALRFPRLVKFRDDKSPAQATTWKEVETIAKLSKV
ncbi:MAG TPA: ATP-dependent DNA ligase [Patescibacteria group bacterium]